MAFIDNRGYARVDSNPNTIIELQTGHNILIACHTVDERVWKYVPGNPAGEKWETLNKNHDYYRDQFIGLGDQSNHNTDKSFSVEALNMTAKLAAAGLAGARIDSWVLAGDGFLYGIYTIGGGRIVKFDPQTDDFVDFYNITGQNTSSYVHGIYRPQDHKIYFVSRNASMVIFDIEQEEFEVKLSGISTVLAVGHWTDIESTKIYSSEQRSDTVYIYDIVADTFSTINPGFPHVNGGTTGAYLFPQGIGKDNKCYITYTTRIDTAQNAGFSGVLVFDCNTDTFNPVDDYQLTEKGFAQRAVWGPNRRYLYVRSTALHFRSNPSGPRRSLWVFDTETNTEVVSFDHTDTGEAINSTIHPTISYGGILGLDGKAMFVPTMTNDPQSKWVVTINTDGSLVIEGIDSVTTLGIPVGQRPLQKLMYGLNGAVYSGIFSNIMWKITYHDKMYEPLEVYRYHDSLNY